MAQRLETDIILNLAGNLAAKARQYGNSMSDFARKNQRAMTLVTTTTRAAGRGIDALGNRYVGLATTLATGATVRNIGNFEEQMTRLGTNAKLSSEQVDELSKSILDVSNQKDIRVDYSQLAAAVDGVIGKSGDLEFVNENLENMGLFMQAFGVDAESTAAIFAQFREKGIRDSKAVMKTVDDLYGQFAIGSVSVKELAGVSAQLFSTYQGQGPEAVKQMGALLQLFTKTKGNANEALTSIQAVFNTFNDKKKVKFLDQQGIDVFKEGTTQLREPVELLLEILEAAKNSPTKLADVFDSTSIQGLASLYDVKNKDLVKQMTGEIGKAGDTQKAAARNAETLNSAMRSLNNSFFQLANERLADPIMDLADAINSVDDDTIKKWSEWGETALYVVGGLIAAKKGLDIAASIKTVFGKASPMPGGKGGGIQDLGAMPVYVVNMPANGFGNDMPTSSKPDANNPNPNQPNSKPKKGFNLKNVSDMLTISYGISLIPEFSPINVRRKSEVDTSELPENFPVAPGLLDVFDEIKAWMFSGNRSNGNGAAADNAYLRNQGSNQLPSSAPYPAMQQNGEMKLKVEVSDDRVKVTPTYLPPGFSVDPDTGTN